jgi:hypothetical protein
MRRFLLLVTVTGIGVALLGGSGTNAQSAANSQSPGFSLTILDRLDAWSGPADTSVAIGTDGRALISYYDGANGDLKVAHCRNVGCRAAATTVIDHEGDVGRWSSLAIGADGLGLVSYFDATNGDLKVAHCQNVACSIAATATLDSEGGPSSIAVGVDGRALIAFVANEALNVAHCSDVVCSTTTLATIDVVQGETHPSIAIGADGLGLISYSNHAEDNPRIDVAHCLDVACSAATIATPWPCFCEQITSIAIGSDGLGLISAADIDSNLAVVHCSNLDCSAGTPTYVGLSLVRAGSIAVGIDGFGLVSSIMGDGQGLHVTHCEDVACSTATNTAVDPSGFAEGYTSISIGADARPLISYYHDSDLKVAHCSNPSCTPRR